MNSNYSIYIHNFYLKLINNIDNGLIKNYLLNFSTEISSLISQYNKPTFINFYKETKLSNSKIFFTSIRRNIKEICKIGQQKTNVPLKYIS